MLGEDLRAGDPAALHAGVRFDAVFDLKIPDLNLVGRARPLRAHARSADAENRRHRWPRGARGAAASRIGSFVHNKLQREMTQMNERLLLPQTGTTLSSLDLEASNPRIRAFGIGVSAAGGSRLLDRGAEATVRKFCAPELDRTRDRNAYYVHVQNRDNAEQHAASGHRGRCAFPFRHSKSYRCGRREFREKKR